MARSQKTLLNVDRRIGEILLDLVEQSGLSRRELAARTSLSANRLGIILRQEPPPATVGEVGQIAAVLGTTATAIITQAEMTNVAPLRRRNVGGVHQDDDDLDAVARTTDPEPTDEQ